MLEKKRMPDLSIVDCYGAKLLEALRPFVKKEKEQAKGFEINELPQ